MNLARQSDEVFAESSYDARGSHTLLGYKG